VEAGVDPSTADVLDQVEFVSTALTEGGVRHRVCEVDFSDLWRPLQPASGEVVFSLMEAPPGQPHLQVAATAVLELLGVRFTGSAAGPIWLTTDKLATRAVLQSEGIAVAAGGRFTSDNDGLFDRVPPPWILKPAREDASLGLDGEPVARTRGAAIARARLLARRFPGQPILVEHLLPGREFNVSVLEMNGQPRILPVAEIDFERLPEGAPHIVGYEAKWQEDHAAYHGTVRTFPDESREKELLETVRAATLRAWEITGITGYARVDLRLDESGTACVLEVNANPCIAPGAGFVAAAARAGLSPAEVVAHIVAAARSAHSLGVS
jgi:D-alanine-D-alanine ligase